LNKFRLNDIFSFNLITKDIEVYKNTGSNPSPRSAHSTLVYNDCLYVYGGYSSSGERLNDIFAFNFKTNKWKEIKTFGNHPKKTSGHKICLYNNTLYTFFGSFGGLSDKFDSLKYEYSYNFNRINLEVKYWEKLKYKGIIPTRRSKLHSINFRF
jgi:N-acetylneuraminic acid mutarotase